MSFLSRGSGSTTTLAGLLHIQYLTKFVSNQQCSNAQTIFIVNFKKLQMREKVCVEETSGQNRSDQAHNFGFVEWEIHFQAVLLVLSFD